ncbi:MAG: hypothetical protein ACLP2Y_07030 [Limisphaerales bacterium]
MPVEFHETQNGRVPEVRLTGKLVNEDDVQFVLVVERLVKNTSKPAR